MSERIVIVGNGIAGMEAAIAARQRAPASRITVVSEETSHLFSRPALMYLLSGQLRLSDTEPKERDAYVGLRLERSSARATGLDVLEHHLRLEDGRALPYDRLLIASGSRPRPGPWPGSELTGIGAFVTMADLAWLEDELGLASSGVAPRQGPAPYGARQAKRVRGRPLETVVVGGGLIGIEVAETLMALGHRVRFIVREEWFWPMALDAREAAWISEHMRSHGIDVMLGTNVERFVGEGGAVTKVETSSGAFDCDLAVIAIGVVPNTAWLEGALPLEERSGGVLVDAGLGAGHDVFAAGDCAAVPWPDGTHRPEPLWYTCRDQGRVAGARLAGHDAKYDRRVWYNSAKLFDVEYTTVGQPDTGSAASEHFAQERGAVRSTLRLGLRDGHVVFVNALGRRWDHTVFQRWIREERDADYVRAHLSEANFDTELVPPLTGLTWQEH